MVIEKLKNFIDSTRVAPAPPRPERASWAERRGARQQREQLAAEAQEAALNRAAADHLGQWITAHEERRGNPELASEPTQEATSPEAPEDTQA